MAGLEDLLGSILGGAQQQQGASGAAPSAGGLDVSNIPNMSQNLNKIMMIAGPILAMLFANKGAGGGQGGGGLQDILGKLQAGGLGGQANSWVGTGENEPVSADQLSAAMPDEIAQIAQQAGMDPSEVSQGLSQLLPGLLNSMTPNGSLPSSQDDLQQIFGQLPGGSEALQSILGGQQ